MENNISSASEFNRLVAYSKPKVVHEDIWGYIEVETTFVIVGYTYKNVHLENPESLVEEVVKGMEDSGVEIEEYYFIENKEK